MLKVTQPTQGEPHEAHRHRDSRSNHAPVCPGLAGTCGGGREHAAEDEKTSSEVYQHCRGLVGSANEKEKEELRQNGGSSNPDAVCIKSMLNSPNYRGGVIAVLVGVPLALVALLGAASAASGMVPGVSLPNMPKLPV